MKAYAVTSDKRLDAAPDIPTVDEAGAPGVYISTWYGLWVPKGTPEEAIEKLTKAAMDGAGRSRGAGAARRRSARRSRRPSSRPRRRSPPIHKAEIEKWWPLIKARPDIKVASSRTRWISSSATRVSPTAPATEPLDIGIAGGRIVAVERNLAADAPVYDARGTARLPGPDRDPHPSRQVAHHRPLRPAGAPHAEPGQGRHAAQAGHDGRGRARRAPSARSTQCILHGTTRMRTQVEVDPGIGMRGFEGVQSLIADYKWAIDIEICVFPQEGPDHLSGHRRAADRGAQARRQGDRRGPALRHRPGRPDPPHLRARARVRRRHRHASRRRHHARRAQRPPGARADRAIPSRRPGHGRPHGEALADAAGRGRGARPQPRRRRRRRHRAADDRPVPDGARPRPHGAARRRRRQPPVRARRQLLALVQQHPQPGDAVRRLLADPHGEPLRQRAAARPPGRDRATASTCSRSARRG